MWLKSRMIQRLGGGRLERLLIGTVSRIELMVLGTHKEPGPLRLIRQVRRERKSLLTANESFILYSLARSLARRPGQMAEVGVFEGASARILCELKGDKTLHLFDTFEGLPQSTGADGDVHRKRQYECTVASVQKYLQAYDHVVFHKGRFPESTHDVEPASYCFVHLDVDLYESTLDALKYFYPKMAPGGILISHDYSVLRGVRQAFDEFLADKPKQVIELPTTQCMFIRLG